MKTRLSLVPALVLASLVVVPSALRELDVLRAPVVLQHEHTEAPENPLLKALWYIGHEVLEAAEFVGDWGIHAADAVLLSPEKLRGIVPTPGLDVRHLPMRPLAPPAVMNAFPTAEGYGAGALWGADTVTANRPCVHSATEIHVITSAASSGPGTLDSILTNEIRDDTVDVIVANVAGEIPGTTLFSDLNCFVYAPWTAPAPGLEHNGKIEIRGDTTTTHDQVFLGVKISPDNDFQTAVQQLAGVRVIWWNTTVRSCNNDCFEIFADSSINGVTLPMIGITVGWPIVGPVVTGGRGLGTRGNGGDVGNQSRGMVWDTDWFKFFVPHNATRTPLIGTHKPASPDSLLGTKVVSGVWYNTDAQPAYSKDTTVVDWINNCFVRGPMSNADRFIEVDTIDSPGSYNQAHIYISGTDTASGGGANPCSDGAPTDQWGILVLQQGGGTVDSTKYGAERTGPLPDPAFPISTVASDEVYPTVMRVAGTLGSTASLTDNAVGAAFRIGCDGSRIWARGDVDSTAVAEARTNGGGPSAPYTAVTDYGPDDTNLGTSSACADTDGDGLPDEFEKVIGGSTDSTSATPEGDPDGDLYANAIEYVIGSDPTAETTPAGDESGTPVSPNTYGNGRRIHLALMVEVVDTTPDTTSIDTIMTVLGDSLDFISALSFYTLFQVNDSQFLLVTKDTLANTEYALLDSAQVDSVCVAAGRSDCPAVVRDRYPGRP